MSNLTPSSSDPRISTTNSSTPQIQPTSSQADNVVMHVVGPALPRGETLPSPPIRSRSVRAQEPGNDVNALTEKQEERRVKQEENRIIGDWQVWVNDPNVNPDIQKERSAVCAYLTNWLHATIATPLMLEGHLIPPNFFSEKLIQDRLVKLTIECPKDKPPAPGLLELLGNLINLKFLFIQGEGVDQLPESIGHLQNLTSLRIKNTNISNLPASVGNLLNLKIAIITNNNRLTRLPASFVQLSKLEHLDLEGSTQLTRLPDH